MSTMIAYFVTFNAREIVKQLLKKVTLCLEDLRQTITYLAEDLVMSAHRAFGAGNMEALSYLNYPDCT